MLPRTVSATRPPAKLPVQTPPPPPIIDEQYMDIGTPLSVTDQLASATLESKGSPTKKRKSPFDSTYIPPTIRPSRPCTLKPFPTSSDPIKRGLIESVSRDIGLPASGKRTYFIYGSTLRNNAGGPGWYGQWNQAVLTSGGLGTISPLMQYIDQGTNTNNRVGNTIRVNRIWYKVTTWLTRAKIGSSHPPSTGYAGSFVPDSTGTNSVGSAMVWPKYYHGLQHVPLNLYALDSPSETTSAIALEPYTSGLGPTVNDNNFQSPYVIPCYDFVNYSQEPYLVDQMMANPYCDRAIFGGLSHVHHWAPYEECAKIAAPSFAVSIETFAMTQGGLYHTDEVDYRPPKEKSIVVYNPNANSGAFPIKNDYNIIAWTSETTNMALLLEMNCNALVQGFIEFEDADAEQGPDYPANPAQQPQPQSQPQPITKK